MRCAVPSHWGNHHQMIEKVETNLRKLDNFGKHTHTETMLVILQNNLKRSSSFKAETLRGRLVVF